MIPLDTHDGHGQEISRKEVIFMPGFDGTGPMGQGPMTGGGRGFCAMPTGAYGPYGYGMRATLSSTYR